MPNPCPPRRWLIFCALLALAAIFSMSWRWAGESGAGSAKGISSDFDQRGPVDPSFCGPLMIPLPPPPIDSPYGVHLYAASPKGTVHLVPLDEALDRLPVALTARPTLGAAEPKIEKSDAALGAPHTEGPSVARPTAPQNETGEEDVQTVVLVLEEYRRAFGAMPMGEQNDEIVRRLQGENPKGIAVLPKSHPNISANGELLDRWGTPYRFHPESAWLTTVRSAGADRQMWTRDDILSENTLPDKTGGEITAGF